MQIWLWGSFTSVYFALVYAVNYTVYMEYIKVGWGWFQKLNIYAQIKQIISHADISLWVYLAKFQICFMDGTRKVKILCFSKILDSKLRFI